LLKEDINLELCELRITGQIQLIRGKVERVPTKTEASKRTLPIPDLLLPLVKKALDKHPDNPLLVPSEAGTPIRPRNLVRQFKELLQKAELPATIRFHDFRHFAATMMLTMGGDIPTTQAMLGHMDASTTRNYYAQALPSRTRMAVNVVVNAAMEVKENTTEGSTEP
jgi:integrase